MVRFRRAAAPPPRDRRQVYTDVALMALAACFSLLTSGALVGETFRSPPAVVADQVVGALCCGALWLRRRHPVGVAVVVVLAGLPSHSTGGPVLVALFTVAVHCRPRAGALVVGLMLVLLPVNLAMRPEDATVPDEVSAAFMLTCVTAVVGWGLTVRYRRRLAATLYERAQRDIREAIAREMHDVLAHRLSLLSVHAGALEYHPGASPEEIRQAASVIRRSAHQALEELRDVIGVLRAGPPDAAGAAERPQPTLGDLPRLAEEAREAGTPVALDARLPAAGGAEPPATVGRTAYRVVQEGLTNARKHAPGAAARVAVRGAPGDGLTVEIRTPLGARPAPAERIPGAGRGLTGLAERVAVAGGRLRHGPDGGDFALRAWLPWPP